MNATASMPSFAEICLHPDVVQFPFEVIRGVHPDDYIFSGRGGDFRSCPTRGRYIKAVMAERDNYYHAVAKSHRDVLTIVHRIRSKFHRFLIPVHQDGGSSGKIIGYNVMPPEKANQRIQASLRAACERRRGRVYSSHCKDRDGKILTYVLANHAATTDQSEGEGSNKKRASDVTDDDDDDDESAASSSKKQKLAAADDYDDVLSVFADTVLKSDVDEDHADDDDDWGISSLDALNLLDDDDITFRDTTGFSWTKGRGDQYLPLKGRGDQEPPPTFLCPLSYEVMKDPVMDYDGSTYERANIVQWLDTNHGTSPITRNVLAKDHLVPNRALRETIYAYMGKEWAAEAEKVLDKDPKSHVPEVKKASTEAPSTNNRSTIDGFLVEISQNVGKDIRLNHNGIAAFTYEHLTIVVEVPETVGSFFLYSQLTYDQNKMVEVLTKTMQLNYLQQETRGGCLSLDTKKDLFFNYTDRTTEINARDFRNILENFIETALKLSRTIKAISESDE